MARKRIRYGYVRLTQIGAELSIAALVALYSLFSTYELTNTLFVLGLCCAAPAVPFNAWLLKTYVDNTPVSDEEAPMVDGASVLGTIREVILPLTKPGLAVVPIFVWLAGRNEFVIAQTLLRPENYPLSVEPDNIATEGGSRRRERGLRRSRTCSRAGRGRLRRGAALRRGRLSFGGPER